MSNSTGENNKINAIVVGDWILDEHWVTGSHRIPTSSRTGGNHRFIFNRANEEIIYVSAAGRVASSLLKQKSPIFSIHGMGVWERDGDNIIKSFFTDYGEDRNQRNEFRVNWKFPEKIPSDIRDSPGFYPGDIDVYNLNVLPHEVGSNRVVRTYDKSGETVKLLERIDFIDNQSLEKVRVGINNIIKEKLLEIRNKTKNNPIQHVIIKDINHGVITNDLIKQLVKSYPPGNVNYYISSKRWMPEWLKYFINNKKENENTEVGKNKKANNKKIKLLIIPQVAAREALREGEFDCWMTKSGFVSLEALNIIRQKSNYELFNNLNIEKLVILPDKERVIAYDKNTNNKLYVQTEFNDNYSEIDLPMASMLFPELIKYLSKDTKREFGQLVGWALHKTVKWRKRQYDYIKYNISRNQKEEDKEMDSKAVSSENNEPTTKACIDYFGKWRVVDLKNAKDDWNHSLSKLGTRDIKEDMLAKSVDSPEYMVCTKKFELWRAKTTLDDYICLSPLRRKKIRNLVRTLKRDEHSQLMRSEVCFIKAAPGSGKSHLVRSLASALGIKILEFNLSQIQSKEQLLNCFDLISTSQTESKDTNPLLVFFDEINTKLDGYMMYSHFLAPLEDGYYTRNNHRFQLKPCIWVFVGTDFQTGKADKASDFKSRFTLPVTDLISEDRKMILIKEEIGKCTLELDHIERILLVDADSEGKERKRKIIKRLKSLNNLLKKTFKQMGKDVLILNRLENIYYGVQFIRSTFKRVTKVSENVLKLFGNIKHDASVRDIRKFIEAIQYIPYEEIRMKEIKAVMDRYEKEDVERIRNLFTEESLIAIKELYKDDTVMVRVYDVPSKKQKKNNYIISPADDI